MPRAMKSANLKLAGSTVFRNDRVELTSTVVKGYGLEVTGGNSSELFTTVRCKYLCSAFWLRVGLYILLFTVFLPCYVD